MLRAEQNHLESTYKVGHFLHLDSVVMYDLLLSTREYAHGKLHIAHIVAVDILYGCVVRAEFYHIGVALRSEATSKRGDVYRLEEIGFSLRVVAKEDVYTVGEAHARGFDISEILNCYAFADHACVRVLSWVLGFYVP